MTTYYKTIFKPYLSDCEGLKKNSDVLEVVRQFSQKFLPGLLTQLEEVDKQISIRYLNMLKMLIFCHRHQKTDNYIQKTPVDFSVVRDPMYLYSKAS